MGLSYNSTRVHEENITDTDISFVIDIFEPEQKSCVVLLGPSWFGTGERVGAWARRLSRDAGALSVVVHFPGQGKSPGREGVVDLEQQLRCFRLARDVVTSQCDHRTPVFYGGSSGGFTTALYASVKDPATHAVFGICPFHSLAAYGPLQNGGVEQVLAQSGSGNDMFIDLSLVDGRKEGVRLDIKRSLPSLQRINLNAVAPNITVPLWMSYGALDTIVDARHIAEFTYLLSTMPAQVQTFVYPVSHGLPGYDDRIEEQIMQFVQYQQGRVQ